MKTIDEQLNIINDTKNGIAQVLNSKGVEVTAETKFADYPDKVAQLMGNTEVDASVSAALTEVTAEYLEQVNAVKAQADGLEESKLDVSVAEATYQPIGNYLTEHQDISGKLDVSVAAETYQPVGNYLTEHQDISGKLDASVAAETYATKAEVNNAGYLTQHQDISGKLDVSVAEATYQPKGEYLTQHQDISGKLDVSVAAETYATKQEVNGAGYLTQHQDISGKLDASVAEATYQPKGEYLTQHQDISGKLDASVAEATYQPKGNYLTEHQDISGKLDASVAEATYQPKGAYLTEHQSLADYALKSELPLVPTNVSAFTNDAGYLTSHQDISNLLDVSTASATYATKQELPDVSGLLSASDVITESHDSLLMSLNRQIVSLATIDYLSTAKFHGIYMEMSGDVWTVAENNEVELLYVKPFGSNTATVSVLMSSGKPKIKMSVGGFEAQYDIPGVVGNNVRMFVPVPGSVVMADLGMLGTGCRINSIVTKSYLVKFGIGDRFDTTALDSKYLTSHQDISGKLDASVAAETYATKQEVNNAGYLTQHQDISGKLDSSVAASTYATKQEIQGLGSEKVILNESWTPEEMSQMYAHGLPSTFDKFKVVLSWGSYEGDKSVENDVIRMPWSVDTQSNNNTKYILRKIGNDWYFRISDTYEYNGQWLCGETVLDSSFDDGGIWDASNTTTTDGYLYSKCHISDVSVLYDSETNKTSVTVEFSQPVTPANVSYTSFIDEMMMEGVSNDYENSGYYLTREITMKQYVDEQVDGVNGNTVIYNPGAETPITVKQQFINVGNALNNKLDKTTAASTYQPKGNYLTSHQDISGKLDSSVAATTYVAMNDASADFIYERNVTETNVVMDNDNGYMGVLDGYNEISATFKGIKITVPTAEFNESNFNSFTMQGNSDRFDFSKAYSYNGTDYPATMSIYRNMMTEQETYDYGIPLSSFTVETEGTNTVITVWMTEARTLSFNKVETGNGWGSSAPVVKLLSESTVTVKQKIAQLEGLIATLHPQS